MCVREKEREKERLSDRKREKCASVKERITRAGREKIRGSWERGEK